MAAKVSLITTVFNGAAYLDEAVASVCRQTFSDWELIPRDDGSSDDSLAIARQWARRDRRIHAFQGGRHGRIAALAAAHQQAEGVYLGWLDADDMLEPEALAATVAHLDARPRTGLVFSHYREIDGNGNLLQYGRRCRLPYRRQALLTSFCVFHFRLFRAGLLAQIGWPQNAVPYAEDYDLVLRLAEVSRFDEIPRPLYRYRLHPQQISQQKRLAQIAGSQTAVAHAMRRRGLADRFELHTEITAHYYLKEKELS